MHIQSFNAYVDNGWKFEESPLISFWVMLSSLTDGRTNVNDYIASVGRSKDDKINYNTLYSY